MFYEHSLRCLVSTAMLLFIIERLYDGYVRVPARIRDKLLHARVSSIILLIEDGLHREKDELDLKCSFIYN